MGPLNKMIFLLISTLESMSISFKRQNMLYGINCGGSQPQTVHGFKFSEDKYYSSNTYVLHNFNDQINGQIKLSQEDFKVFKYGRFSRDYTFSYEIPLVKGPGQYELVLFFIETYHQQANKRSFHVRVGDTVVFQSLDIFCKRLSLIKLIKAQSGNYPLFKQIQFVLSDEENIEIDSEICPNAYKYKTNALVIEFDRIQGQDPPKIESLLLFQGYDNEVKFDQQYYDQQEILVNQKYIEDLLMDEIHEVEVTFQSLMDTVFSVRGLIVFIMIGGMILCLTLTDTTTETPNAVNKKEQEPNVKISIKYIQGHATQIKKKNRKRE